MIRFEVPGKPGHLRRARVGTIAGKARTFDPKENRNDREAIRTHALEAMGDMDPMEGPVHVSIVANFQRPKSKTYKTRPNPSYYHTGPPDLDNIVKLILDAMNGVVYVDDKQVAIIGAVKTVLEPEKYAHMVVTVSSLPIHPDPSSESLRPTGVQRKLIA